MLQRPLEAREVLNPGPPTEAELIDLATAMGPALRSRAKACEAARRMSSETISNFRNAGFFRILQPVQHGGYGMSPLSLCRVVIEVGRADMSAAWVLFVLALHPFELGLMDPRAAEEVWGNDPDALLASSIAPFGAVRQVEGGFEVNGKWRFSSGIEHSKWVGVAGMVALQGEEQKDYRMCLLPTQDVMVDQDSWHTFGLAGTGSKDLEINRVFVPHHMSYSLLDGHRMTGQDKLAPNLRYPFWVVFNAVLGAAVIGGAIGGVDEAIRQMATRVNTANQKPAAEDPFTRSRIARASILVQTCIARYEAMFGHMSALIGTNLPIPISDRVRYMTEITQCGADCVEATLTVYKATGARGLLLDNNMQAILRNVLAGSNHVAMQLDPALHSYGAALMGAESHVLC